SRLEAVQIKRFVETPGSVGSIKTLLSRHSTLNAALPAATVTTGSPTSITVRWSSAVWIGTTQSRLGVAVSIFCAQEGTASAKIISPPKKRCMVFSPFDETLTHSLGSPGGSGGASRGLL